MTKEEYINSLSIDELRVVASAFYEWFNDDGCPPIEYNGNDFPCPWEEDGHKRDDLGESCESCQSEHGCWLKYYVWRYRQKREGLAKLRSIHNE